MISKIEEAKMSLMASCDFIFDRINRDIHLGI